MAFDSILKVFKPVSYTHLICLVAQKVEELGIHDRHDEIEGVIGIRNDDEQDVYKRQEPGFADRFHDLLDTSLGENYIGYVSFILSLIHIWA